MNFVIYSSYFKKYIYLIKIMKKTCERIFINPEEPNIPVNLGFLWVQRTKIRT